MTTSLVANGNGALAIDDKALLSLVTDGDCARLDERQKLAYYRARCEAAGLDYRAQPFQYVKLNGKTVLYALKACSEQLAAKHGLSVRLVETPADVQELAASGGCRAFTARVSGNGRETDDVGVVTIGALKGDALANAVMKGATKAKRRAVLAHCGLGMLDETEIETIPRAQPIRGTIKDEVPDGRGEGHRNDGPDGTHAGALAGASVPLVDRQAVVADGEGAAPAGAGAGQDAGRVREGQEGLAVDPHEALAARLIEACEAGFPDKRARFAWWSAHLNEINELPKEFARAVVKAYDATRP